MDSLPTGTTHSLFLVLAAALSPVILLFLADAIERVRRRKVFTRAVDRPQASVSPRSTPR
jgi:hypothetical protein